MAVQMESPVLHERLHDAAVRLERLSESAEVSGSYTRKQLRELTKELQVLAVQALMETRWTIREGGE